MDIKLLCFHFTYEKERILELKVDYNLQGKSYSETAYIDCISLLASPKIGQQLLIDNVSEVFGSGKLE